MIVGFFPATTMPDADWWQALWPDPPKILAEMGVEPGVVAADLCCGDGLFTVPLARIAKRVYAIDIDPAMLDRARARVAEARVDNCEFVVADAMAVDAVVPEPVDYVFLATPSTASPISSAWRAPSRRRSNPKANSGSSIGIVGRARKQWFSDSRAAQKPGCGWRPMMWRRLSSRPACC